MVNNQKIKRNTYLDNSSIKVHNSLFVRAKLRQIYITQNFEQMLKLCYAVGLLKKPKVFHEFLKSFQVVHEFRLELPGEQIT